MVKVKNALLLLLFLLIKALYGQELPPIQVFTPNTYGAESQNWAIAQSEEQIIYVANNRGLLEYNGANWHLYLSPNNTILRSVTTSKGRVYTGCYMELGYWERNSFGLLEYTSLKPLINDELIEDEQFWKIIPLDNWIVFQSLDRIYLYNSNTEVFKIIEPERPITKMFLVNETIMFQVLEDGLYRIENGLAKLVTADSLIRDKEIVNVFEENDALLIHTVNDGFYLLNNNLVEPWKTDADQLMTNSSIYNSIRLTDGTYLLGTISNGVIHLTKNGNAIQVFNQSNALSNNTVLSLFEDSGKNVWLGLDEGINCINMQSPFREFNNQNGDLGTVYASMLHKGKLYLGTNQGLFCKTWNSSDEFQFVNDTRGQVWSLRVINDDLLCGHNNGSYAIDNGKASLISSVPGAWDFKSIPGRSDQVLQGNYEGLHLLEKNNGTWKVKHSISGFTNSSRFFEFAKNNTVFVNHEYKGVYKLQLSNDYTQVQDVAKIEELPKGLHSSIVKYNDQILYASKDGVFIFDESLGRFEKDSLLSSVLSQEDYITGKLVLDDHKDRLWMFTNSSVSYVDQGKFSSKPEINKVFMPSSLRNGMIGFENICAIGDNKYLLGTSNGYLTINLKDLKSKQYQVNINSIKKGKLGIADTFINLDEGNEFNNDENNIEFSFSVPEYNKFNVVKYRHRLKGIYDNWSTWSTESSVFYENLPHGDYEFEVSAKVGMNETESSSSYAFSISRPWHLSNLMLIVYLLGIALFSLFMHNLYKRYYKKQQARLLEKAQRDLELKQLENEQQRMRYENEALLKDIESKNRELAISTMSLIKKNEFLNDIKNELNKNDGNASTSVVKIIDKNLNNTDDWKLFEEAFNNADKDFLKKMKSLHPSLTSNDLRLCAYLRLNLSSKEIAPLLNISPRSVEVKRYRLRKKMELPHETGLTNYILEI